MPFKSTEMSAGGAGDGWAPEGSLQEGLGCGLTELLTGSSGRPPTGEESKLAWSPGLLSTGDATCAEARGEPGMRGLGMAGQREGQRQQKFRPLAKEKITNGPKNGKRGPRRRGPRTRRERRGLGRCRRLTFCGGRHGVSRCALGTLIVFRTGMRADLQIDETGKYGGKIFSCLLADRIP